MTYELHMSGVVTGSLNCFCLACDVFLQSARDATHHVRTSQHQNKAGAVLFSDKFPDDYIKKFKRGYYCKFCNVLMPIASKVTMHVSEEEHKHKKGVLLLTPLGLDVVAFNNVLIEEKAWHGLIEGVCSLCNAEFEDEDAHKAAAEHSLNLVLKPIQFAVDNAIFRHLDDTAVQCMTCNKLLAPGRMSKHFADAEHLDLYAKRHIETNGDCQGTETEKNRQDKVNNMTSVTEYEARMNSKIDIEVENKREDKNNNKKSSTENKSKILESIVKYQTKGININLETETAFCKKCSEVVTFDFNEIENHIDNHSSVTEVDSDLLYPSHLDQHLNRVDINDKTTQSSDDQHDEVNDTTLKALRENVQHDSLNGEDNDTNSTCSVGDLDFLSTEDYEKDSQEEARDFAKANEITYNMNNKQSFCRICEVRLPATFKSLKEHVDGAHHNRLVASSKSSITQLSKQRTIELIDTSFVIRTFFYTASMINEKYCILRDSFYLILKNDSRVRCFVCDINLPPYLEVEDHMETFQHLNWWKKVPVITSEENEFIREVHPGLYHCGFCHLVVSGWTDMKHHLECSDHQEHKTVWESRLRQHIPEVQQHKMRQQMESMVMRRFLSMFQ